MSENDTLVYKEDENVLWTYMEDGEVLAVQFGTTTDYPFIILKDEPGKAIDGSWTVYSPLADVHEEVVDIEELYKYIGLTIVEFQPMIGYGNAGDMGLESFQGRLRELQDQAKIWDVRHKEGQ